MRSRKCTVRSANKSQSFYPRLNRQSQLIILFNHLLSMNPASSSPQPPQAAVLMMQDNTTSRDPTDLPAFTADESAPTLAVGNSAAGNDTGRALVDENVPGAYCISVYLFLS